MPGLFFLPVLSIFIIYIALTPITGYLADRLSARRVITASALILSIGAAGMWIPIIALVQRWFASDRRGLALGILCDCGADAPICDSFDSFCSQNRSLMMVGSAFCDFERTLDLSDFVSKLLTVYNTYLKFHAPALLSPG